MAGSWLVGEVTRLRLEILDAEDLPADPSTLRLKVKTPGGVVSVYSWPFAPELVRTAVGVFYADVPLLEPGTYAFRFESDGPLMGASERLLSVRKSVFS